MDKNIIKNKLFLAPMAGYTDQAFRRLCLRYGAEVLYSEMISAKAIKYKDKKTLSLKEISEEEEKAIIGIQIFGNQADILENASKFLSEDDKVDIIDLNMGCPAPKIVNNNEGSALLRDPSLIYNLLSSMRKSTDKLLSGKIRIGIDGLNNYIEVARAIEEAGVDFLIVHGRTREEYYRGNSNWDIIGEIKSKIGIPVIGNGDIDSPEFAKTILKDYNIDGLMIGRASVGRPYIFNQIREYLETGTYREVGTVEKFDIIFEHVDLIIESKGEKIGVREMRKHLHSYLKGMKNSSNIKNKINSITDKVELVKTLEQYRDELLTLGL